MIDIEYSYGKFWPSSTRENEAGWAVFINGEPLTQIKGYHCRTIRKYKTREAAERAVIKYLASVPE